MKKTVIIGDIHCKTVWKDILKKESNADRIIFIGDYFDDFEMTPCEKQIENFKEICALKEKGDKEVILLYGNHEFHYLSTGTSDQYSGFRKNCSNSFNEILQEKEKLLQIAYLDENDTIYSHAGITNSFLNNNFINSKDPKTIVDSLNSLFKSRPDTFKFYQNDQSGCGDDINQSPLWVRPRALVKDKVKGTMIIGHTSDNKIIYNIKEGIFYIDCLDYVKEYLVCIDDKYTITTL